MIQAKHVGAAGLANAGSVAAAAGDAWPAARFLGAAEGIWESIGYALGPSDQDDHDAVLSRLSTSLGAERLDRGRREGAALSLDEAMGEALLYLGGPEFAARTS